VRSVKVRERAPTFGTNSRFQVELRRRVDAYFELSGRRQRDCWQMYVKTAILVARFVVSAGFCRGRGPYVLWTGPC